MGEEDAFDTKAFPMGKAEDLNSYRYLVWQRRMTSACEYRGYQSPPELYAGKDSYSDKSLSALIKDHGWGCHLHPYGNMAVARGDSNYLVRNEDKGESPFLGCFIDGQEDQLSFDNKCYENWPGTQHVKEEGRVDCEPFKEDHDGERECKL